MPFLVRTVTLAVLAAGDGSRTRIPVSSSRTKSTVGRFKNSTLLRRGFFAGTFFLLSVYLSSNKQQKSSITQCRLTRTYTPRTPKNITYMETFSNRSNRRSCFPSILNKFLTHFSNRRDVIRRGIEPWIQINEINTH